MSGCDRLPRLSAPCYMHIYTLALRKPRSPEFCVRDIWLTKPAAMMDVSFWRHVCVGRRHPDNDASLATSSILDTATKQQKFRRHCNYEIDLQLQLLHLALALQLLTACVTFRNVGKRKPILSVCLQCPTFLIVNVTGTRQWFMLIGISL